MRTFRPLLALAVAGAALFAAPGAQAAVNCFGPDSMYLCVVTPQVNKTTRTECVYVGGDTCQTVTVPWFTTTGSAGIYCGGAWRCDQ
jgi:hypothetical protein